MARDTGRFGLHGLCPSYLQTIGSGKGIEGHILGLERSRMITVLPEDAAKSGCKNTLAYIASGTGQHEGI